MQRSLPDDVRQFVDTVTWTFAKTYARTWPHEYIVRRPDNAHLVNRCDEDQTYEARLAAGTLPGAAGRGGDMERQGR